jgi:ADP-heptose:LPS heptosyltransferase
LLTRRLRRLAARNQAPRRILVIHFGGLGDTLMLTPALAAIKQKFPTARVDCLMLHAYVKEAFREHPRLDSIGVLPPYNGKWIISRFANLSGPSLVRAAIRYYPELLLRLNVARYDLAVNFGLGDFDRRLGNALMYCADVPIRVGTLANDSLLTHSRANMSAHHHRVDEYLELLFALGITNADTTYEYPVIPSDAENLETVLNERGIDQNRPLAVIHPGGKLHVNSRRWPAGYFARVCDFLSSHGFQVVLTGDQNDATVCDEVLRLAGRQIVSIAGSLTFSQSAALLKLADLVITNDTATLHLAEAIAVPRVISIFGPTDPSLLVPKNERHIVFRSSLPCAPCMGGIIDANTERCWMDAKEECLSQTTPDHVIAVLRESYAKPATRVASA